jgi:hypothetical protein
MKGKNDSKRQDKQAEEIVFDLRGRWFCRNGNIGIYREVYSGRDVQGSVVLFCFSFSCREYTFVCRNQVPKVQGDLGISHRVFRRESRPVSSLQK